MEGVNTLYALRIINATLRQYRRKKPIAVSFEVTHNCNANCAHCDKGAELKENLASPEKFAEIADHIQPVVAQISGGEPLLRPDILDIVKILKKDNRPPFMVFVTNGALLNEEKYEKLRGAGVQQFCMSLDFPDNRHDKNRQIPGLFQHLSKLIPTLTAKGHDDIILMSVIRKKTIPYLVDCAETILGWGAKFNFSAYTALRTNAWGDFPSDADSLALLKTQIEKIIKLKRKTGRVITGEKVMWRYYQFFKNKGIPNCRAGERCAVVNPDGRIAACAMYRNSYDSLEELLEKFTPRHACGECYVSMRANSERSLWEQTVENIRNYRASKRYEKLASLDHPRN